jgi:UPF0716 family protein affecting phage T7 exclusion
MTAFDRPQPDGALRRWSRLGAGGLLFVAGVLMLVLPGPGLVTIVFALALLERDLPVARHLLARIREWWPSREPASD